MNPLIKEQLGELKARGFVRDSQELTAFFRRNPEFEKPYSRFDFQSGHSTTYTPYKIFGAHHIKFYYLAERKQPLQEHLETIFRRRYGFPPEGIAQAFTKLLHSYDLHWSRCEHGLRSGASKSSPLHHVPNKKNRSLFIPGDMEKFRQFLDGPNKA
jgi:hypothetical protein